MSKYIDEIITDLKENPTTFRDNNGSGVMKGDIVISQHGNGFLTSIIHVHINNKSMPTTYVDLLKLERAIGKWYKSASLNLLCR